MSDLIKLNRSHIAKALKGRSDITQTQLNAIGLKTKPINWIDVVLGKSFTLDQLSGFTGTLPLDPRVRRVVKKKKVKKKPVRRIKKKVKKPPPYKESYSDNPDWDVLRKSVYKRDNYRCVACGKKGKLNAHHLLYDRDKPMYEVPIYYLVSLCDDCHKLEHSKRLVPPTKHY